MAKENTGREQIKDTQIELEKWEQKRNKKENQLAKIKSKNEKKNTEYAHELIQKVQFWKVLIRPCTAMKNN